MFNIINILPTQISINTLVLCSILPMVYFFYRYRYWAHKKFTDVLDAVLMWVTIIVMVAILMAFYFHDSAWSNMNLQGFYLAHLLPCIVTLLLVGVYRPHVKIPRRASSKGIKVRKGSLFNFIKGKSGETTNGLHPRIAKFRPKAVSTLNCESSWKDWVLPYKCLKFLDNLDSIMGNSQQVEDYKGRCFLMTGPRGCGKHSLAKIVARRSGRTLYTVDLHSFVRAYRSNSLDNLRVLKETALKAAPSMVIFTGIEILNTDYVSDSAKDYFKKLCKEVKSFIQESKKANNIGVVLMSDRPEFIPKILAKSVISNPYRGSFRFSLPDHNSRVTLFDRFLHSKTVGNKVNTEQLATLTEGLSPADISQVANLAELYALKDQLKSSKTKIPLNNEVIKRAVGNMVVMKN